jgi:hypothetical protein
MAYDYVELIFPGEDLGWAQRISSLLADNGYRSFSRECGILLERYLPGVPVADQSAGTSQATHTTDVLIPPTDPTGRILICERPRSVASAGKTVAVVAIGRVLRDAHRLSTAVRMLLDTKGLVTDGLAGHILNDNGRAITRRFWQEWVYSLGLKSPADLQGEEQTASRSMAAVQMLLALRESSPLLGNPAILRSQVDRMPKKGSGSADPELLEGMVARGLVEKSFVLVCRQSSHIVGVGQDMNEIQQAMSVSLQCPHCRKPLREESQDVLYSLTSQGEEFARGTRWIREVLETSLRRKGCDVVVRTNGAAEPPIDGAACYQENVFLFRVQDGVAGREDLQVFMNRLRELEGTLAGIPLRGVYLAAEGGAGGEIDNPLDLQIPCTVIDLAHLETGLDQLLESAERENFARITGISMSLPLPDPSRLTL